MLRYILFFPPTLIFFSSLKKWKSRGGNLKSLLLETPNIASLFKISKSCDSKTAGNTHAPANPLSMTSFRSLCKNVCKIYKISNEPTRTILCNAIQPSSCKVEPPLQSIENNEYEGTTRRAPGYCNTAPSIQALQAILSPNRNAFIPELDLRSRARYRNGLHT